VDLPIGTKFILAERGRGHESGSILISLVETVEAKSTCDEPENIYE